jgi:hypothetical protein
MRAFFLRLSIGLTLVACHRPPPSPVDTGAPAPPAPSPVATGPDASAGSPARCKVVSTGAALGVGADSVLVGDVVPTAAGFAAGLLRSVGASMSAAVAVVPEDLSTATMVDFGVAPGDTPPPHPFVTANQLFAATYVRGREDGGRARSRTLGFFRIDGDKSSLVATLEQAVDESAAVDVAGGAKNALVAWDEDAPVATRNGAGSPAGGHGVIKVAIIEPTRAGEPHVASPETSDADEPQVVSRAGGYWVAWLAHRPQVHAEAGTSTDAQALTDLEAPAEARESRWIESVALDDAGKAAGPVRRLTSASGHVSAFTLAARPTPSPSQDTLDVFARDDEEASEGVGGRLLRVTVHVDSADPPTVLVPDGAGRGPPELLGSGPSWLVYADSADHTRILPLGEAGSPLGAPSVEPALFEARALTGTPGAAPTAKGKPALFAVFPAEHASADSPGRVAPIRALICAP